MSSRFLIISAVVVSLGLGVYYFKFRDSSVSEAEIESESSEQVLDIREKIAQVISLIENVPIDPDQKVEWLKEVKKLAQELTEPMNAFSERAASFEEGWSSEDVHKITESNPGSFFRQIGKFYSQQRFSACTQVEYENLKRNFSLWELYERAPHIMMLASLYDDMYRQEYLKKIRTLWDQDTRWQEFKDLDAYYAYQYLLEQAGYISRNFADRKAQYESLLIESGVPQNEVHAYVLQTAEKSPSCLGQLSMDLIRWIQVDVTLARGKFFLEGLQKYWTQHRKLAEDWQELVPPNADPLFKKSHDGWYNDYQFKAESGGYQVLFSTGPDGQPDTEDDLVIGRF